VEVIVLIRRSLTGLYYNVSVLTSRD
jgi:hypothetical protein